jgi:hypothetical protein
LLAFLAAMAVGVLILNKVEGEISFHQNSRRRVSQIMNGTLKPAHDGVVTLPSALSSTSLYGRAYVIGRLVGRNLGFIPYLAGSWTGPGRLLVSQQSHAHPGADDR